LNSCIGGLSFAFSDQPLHTSSFKLDGKVVGTFGFFSENFALNI
jgi:hypothetical protein